jgi:ATP-dependent helicase/nuclease subunit A
LDAVNCVFEDTMHKSVGDIDYDDAARLYYGAKDYGEAKADAKAELLVLPEENWKQIPVKEKVAWEAMTVAKRIKELIDSDYQVVDHFEDGVPVLRKVRFSDMMILVRKAKKRANKIKQVLDDAGIPTMVISKEGYFMAAEVILVLNFISVINNPRQDIPLLGVLHSFIGGFKEGDLAEIRGMNKNELFYDSLMRYRTMGTEKRIVDKVKAFKEKLDTYRELSGRESVYDLLLTIFENEGIMDHFRLMSLGEQRVANLKILLQKAEEFASTGFVGLSEFVRYIENVKSREIDFGEANILDENANVVRIYTMHKSKGLEFPVCFLMGLGEGLSSKRDSKDVPCDKELGMAADYTDIDLRIKRKSFSRASILTKDALERRGEDLRLLYVAMTRAREKLIMVGTAGKKLMEKEGTYGPKRPFTTSEVLGATTYMGILLAEAERNSESIEKITCTVEETEGAAAAETLDKTLLKVELKEVEPMDRPFEEYAYPHESLANVYTKTTVSDLKKAAYMEENEGADDLFRDAEGYKEDGGEEYVPAFMRAEEKKVSGSLYGTAHHRVMELLDFTAFTEEEMAAGGQSANLMAKLTEMRTALVDNYALPSEENKLVRNDTVAAFLADDVAKRMRKAEEAGKLYREQPFVLSLPANEVDETLPASEHVLIQGVIDVYFEEDGELVLLDYKTDSKVDEEELIKRYKAQLKYYGKALEKLEKKEVKETLIYSFFLHKTIRL